MRNTDLTADGIAARRAGLTRILLLLTEARYIANSIELPGLSGKIKIALKQAEKAMVASRTGEQSTNPAAVEPPANLEE